MTLARASNPALFVVGCPRSGTTLLQRLLDAHPDIALIHEFWWMERWYRERVGLTDDGMVTAVLADELASFRKSQKKLGMDAERLRDFCVPGESYPSFLSKVFDEFAARKHKTLAGDKSPGYILEIPLLHAWFPQSRFVHLLRDGRDVWLSVRAWDRGPKIAARFSTWDKEPVITAALWWAELVRRGREDGCQLPPGAYHELRYEDLLFKPEKFLSRLCLFLSVPFTDSMLAFHEGRTRKQPGLNAKDAWLPMTPGLRNWRTELDDDDIELFEAAAGDLLEELGYPRQASVGTAALDRVDAVRDAVGAEMPSHWY
jgi:hypothetical protein